MSVTRALFRLHRRIILIFGGVLLTVELIFATWVALAVHEVRFSPWLTMAVPATKYWLLVVGIMLVTVSLRQFVANGTTRREFLTGAAAFGLLTALAFALAVVLGHGLESVLLDAAGVRGGPYPAASLPALAGELGQVLPGALAYPVTGALIAAGFYRWRAWTALAVMLLASVPVGVADGLLGIDESGDAVSRLPYVLSLGLSLAVTAVAGAAFHRAMRDVAIKRAAG